jgi:2-amino-4-hydroxy-6-hydroxymethyldihydropteridine diphosphokinase
LGRIEQANVAVRAVSPLYETRAVGNARQPAYVNAVALLETALSPESLLRVLKRIERESGRRGGRPWGPRTLDIDVVDYKGLVAHWTDGRGDFGHAGPRPLVLPHPLAHERPFVLRPLMDIAPGWRHPVLKRSARELWSRVSRKREGAVLKRRNGGFKPETAGETPS